MYGLKERPYPAHVLISFWCDSDDKNIDFFTFQIFADILVLFILAIFLNISSMHIGPWKFAL